MEIYKIAYAKLVGAVDDALTILDTGDLLQVNHVREMLQNALLEVEELIVSSQDSP
ncbi:MAG: hypothetical protein HDT16_01840 [Oscillibacter sp.]|nr:hypothetical protein [Oscillibacter sp.]